MKLIKITRLTSVLTAVSVLLVMISVMISAMTSVTAGASQMDDLLKNVQQSQVMVKKENIVREREFLAKKSNQKGLLATANKELRSQEAISKRLIGKFEQQEKVLTSLENDLNIAKGTLGEMFGVVRQVSGDLKGQLQNSVISAQIPGRLEFLGKMAESKSLPDIAALEQLWFELQREMTESGKITKFEGQVVMPDGNKMMVPITRIGSFNLVSDGDYLNYLGETKQVIKLARQPSSRFTGLISDLENGDEPHNAFALDPSRGAILGMLVQAPSLFERMDQGGLVGYIILALLVVGLGLVAERWWSLQRAQKEISAQMGSEKANESNPLGKIMASFEKFKGDDLETLELKLDEAIMKATPPLTRGLSTIKLLSAVAPLLGLLGTVTGMILTFQSITLFGTGDPKLMAGGISQALITTVLGLVCAIPLLLLHNVVNSKSNRLVQILEEQSAGMMASKYEKGDA